MSVFSERLQRIIFVLCLCIVSFVGGAAVMRYQAVGVESLKGIFDVADILSQRLEDAFAPPPAAEETEKKGRITVSNPKAYPGYTLFTSLQSNAIRLIDMDGQVVHQWELSFDQIWPDHPHVSMPVAAERIFVAYAYMYPNGDVLAIYMGDNDMPYGYGLVKMDKDSHVLWKYYEKVHHDLYVSQNNNLYVLIQKVYKEALPGLEELSYPLVADAITVLSPAGKELERIPLLEAFKGTPYEYMLLRGFGYRKGDMHTNSVMRLDERLATKFPQFKAGQLLVSIRNLNAIAVVDPVSKKIVWAMQGMWRAQHEAMFLENGHIALFDNQGLGKRRSRVMELDPATQGVSWEFRAGKDDREFFTRWRGSQRLLPGGNMLIVESYNRRMFEVTRDKEIVWEYRLPQTRATKQGSGNNAIYSAYRFDYSYPTFLPPRK